MGTEKCEFKTNDDGNRLSDIFEASLPDGREILASVKYATEIDEALLAPEHADSLVINWVRQAGTGEIEPDKAIIDFLIEGVRSHIGAIQKRIGER